MKYKVGDKVRFVKPIRVNGEYGYVDKDVIFTISYFDYEGKKYWIGNMVFGAKMLEEITEPVATKNFTGALIERIKGEGQDDIQSW
jgi:hypothetical protein